MFTATKTHYADLLHRLSPRGKFWTSLTPGLTAIYQAIGSVFADVHNRGLTVLTEARPTTATVTLDQWLAAYGLPEPGSVLPASTAERRALLLSKITTEHGQSVARMVAICTACGVTATVDEWFDAARPQTWRLLMGGDCIRFRCGAGRCGDKLVDFSTAGAAAVQQIERAKPVHTTVEYWDV